MATTDPALINLRTYVDKLLGRTNTVVDNDVILAGMADIVNKFELYNPAKLEEMETQTTIASSPVTVHNISPSIRVNCGNEECVRVNIPQHIKNSYSLKNDSGKTTYYYTIGNKIYIYPWNSANTYTMLGLSYGITGSAITWPNKLIYPLALFCGSDIIFRELIVDLGSLRSLLTTLSTTMSLGTTFSTADLLAEFDAVQARLDADDVELANSHLGKIRAMLDEFAARLGPHSIFAQNAATLLGSVSVSMNLFLTIKSRYNEYFGAVRQEGKE